MYPLLVKSCAHLCAWYSSKSLQQDELAGVIKNVFGHNINIFEKIPRDSTFKVGLTRWFSFWGGRSLMFFAKNLIQNWIPQLCNPEILPESFWNKFHTEFYECLYYFPEVMAYLYRDTSGNR